MNRYTARIALDIITPRGISAGLGVLGIRWNPVPWEQCPLMDEEGLYAWVDGIGARSASGAMKLAADPLDRAVLYHGIGQGVLGVRGRLLHEHAWIGPDAGHAHGITMHARRAGAVVGAVDAQETDLSWLPELVHEDGAEIIRHWIEKCRQNPKALLEASERIAIRLGIHLGDTVAPVQSQHAGAWNTNAPHDWAAYAAAAYLRRDNPADRTTG
ncbi:hypothetical protein [Embleya scabrispora]|uniref:hypothetical protein n=1 Tax=Embleya scabrispora TaxID=159449 RepID=UPI00037FD50A|nr:hypothetical protein [Embleya scabrispora]MYS87894.1 hypothetical protein [Streptomyces sp. SID5474]